MKTKFQTIAYAIALLLLGCATSWSQGSTSSRINGSVISNNENLIGATVVAIHQPTGLSMVPQLMKKVTSRLIT